MKGRILVPIISSIVVLVLTGAIMVGDSEPGRSQERLAVVAGHIITKDAFQSSYAEYLLKTGTQDNYAGRRAFLDNLINHALVVRSMRDGGIEQEHRYQYEKEAIRTKLLIDAHLAHVLFDTMNVSERELRALFNRMNTRIKARHLFARTRPEADSLYNRLGNGERFEDLAREIFTDPVLASRGGSVGFFGFDEMDPAFEDAAYRLAVGEISRPVRTTYGYSIIQVEERIEHPLLTETDFESKKGQLRTYLNRRKRTEARFEYSRRVAEAADISFEAKTLEHLLARIRGGAFVSGPEDENTWWEEPLVEFTSFGNRITWTVADFLERSRFTSEDQRDKVATAEQLQAFISGLVVREIQLEQARTAGYDSSTEFQRALEAALNAWVFEEAWRRLARETIVPEDSLLAYFKSNRESFVVPEKVQVSEILFDNKSEADLVMAELGHTSFDEAARPYARRPEVDAEGADPAYFSRQQLGRFADAVFEAAPGTILGPFEVNGQYVVLRVGTRIPARPGRFEEVRKDIVSVLKDRYVRARFVDHIAELRTRYEVLVDERALAMVNIPL